MISRKRAGLALALPVAAAFALRPTSAEDQGTGGLEALASQVQEKVFPNGLRLLVLEKHTAPIVAMATTVDVGSVDENTGETGIAHLFEHMAFKGSTTVGGSNWQQEKPAIEKTEKAFLHLKDLRAKRAPKSELAEAEKAWHEAQDEAKKFVVTDEYSTILQRHGGSGLNAFTSTDSTCYHVTLPANRLELWFELEAERFRDPVMREFYKERDAVKEERRMRVESNPYGQLEEEFQAAAYHAHPYGRPVIGFMCDLEALSATTAKKFFEQHYAPNHMTIALVGDVRFDQACAFAEKYFGTMPRGPELDPLPTVEPPSIGERRVEVESEATPLVMLGWLAVPAKHEDTAPLEVLSDVIFSGRTSRLYKALVTEKKIASESMGATIGLPGEKYANLFYISAQPIEGHTNDEVVRGIEEVVAALQKDLVPEEELASVKARERMASLQQLKNKETLAIDMGLCQARRGDWHELFTYPGKRERVTPEDVRRVARKYLVKAHRVRGDIVPPSKAAEKNGKEQGE